MRNQPLPTAKQIFPELHGKPFMNAWGRFDDRYGAYTRTAVSSLSALVLAFVMTACASDPSPTDSVTAMSGSDNASGVPETYKIVDCLLPGQIRQLGTHMTYVTERRHVRTTKEDCTIRGGEQVSKDPGK